MNWATQLGRLALAAAALLVLGAGCKNSNDSSASPEGTADGSTSLNQANSAADAAPERKGIPLYPIRSPAPVLSDTEWPAKDPEHAEEKRKDVRKLGYLRRGAMVLSKGKVIKKSSCLEGWYELVDGGFVCGKYATRDKSAKELEDPPHPPFAEGPLPYEYGMNLTHGTPLYRRYPTRKERNESELGLVVGKRDPDLVKQKARAAKSSKGEGVPWYLRKDANAADLSLDDLQEGGLIITRMVRGFYVSIDTLKRSRAGYMYRTTRGQLAPKDHILVHKPKVEFAGVDFTDPKEKRRLPLAFITHPSAWKYRFKEGEERARRNDHVDRFSIVALTGKSQVSESRRYYETTEGYWVRDLEITRAEKPPEIPKGIKPGEKWIDVNLGMQSLVTMIGDKPQFATWVSTGRKEKDDPKKDYSTPTGEFRIYIKHVAATMDDDKTADGPYSIQDVPWVMYFNKSYALHGAFWHSRFGHTKSHGCVNLTPGDARKIFDWVEPKLPEGWHGVRAFDDHNPGTRVIVHE